MGKRIGLLVLILAMIMGVFGFVAAETDYGQHWASKEIQYLVDEGIVDGYPDGSFRPNKDVTRAEFMKMINGAFDLRKEGKVPFSDVNTGDWYYNYIAVGTGEGYITGYEDNTVRPNRTITRQEAATMVGKALGLKELNQANMNFTDSNNISNWADGWINAVVEEEYMQGYPEGTFLPKKEISRAETAKIIINVLGVEFPDEDTETKEQEQAVKKAESYLEFSSFSRSGLIGQLEFEGFTKVDATYAVDKLNVNWKEQAVKSGESYLEFSSFSRSGLIDQLEYEGFTNEEATYGVDQIEVDWKEQAVKKAESYLDFTEFSRNGLIDQLVYEGFSLEDATYAVDQLGL